MTIASKTLDLVTAIGSYGAAVIARRKAAGEFVGPAYTRPTPVAFSTTPVFNAATSNVFQMAVLTNNVPGATVINGTNGQTITIRLVQDATGGRTFTVPGNVLVTGTYSIDPNDVNLLTITYSAASNRWEGTWTAVAA